MTKNEAMEKAKQIIDNDKRKTILEKRLTRLENLIKNESADDPAVILLDAASDGYISMEALCRELIAQMSVDELWSVCDALDLVEESKKASDKSVKNEDMDDVDDDMDDEDENPSYNSYDICREILDHYGVSDWIGERDIDEYLDTYYADMDDEDRWFVHDRMDKFANVDPYRSVQDDDEDDEDWDEEDDEDWDEDEEDFESKKRPARRAKNESTKRPAKRSLVSRYKK